MRKGAGGTSRGQHFEVHRAGAVISKRQGQEAARAELGNQNFTPGSSCNNSAVTAHCAHELDLANRA